MKKKKDASSGWRIVARLAQLVRYLERETGGRVTHLDFRGANRGGVLHGATEGLPGLRGADAWGRLIDSLDAALGSAAWRKKIAVIPGGTLLTFF